VESAGIPYIIWTIDDAKDNDNIGVIRILSEGIIILVKKFEANNGNIIQVIMSPKGCNLYEYVSEEFVWFQTEKNLYKIYGNISNCNTEITTNDGEVGFTSRAELKMIVRISSAIDDVSCNNGQSIRQFKGKKRKCFVEELLTLINVQIHVDNREFIGFAKLEIIILKFINNIKYYEVFGKIHQANIHYSLNLKLNKLYISII